MDKDVKIYVIKRRIRNSGVSSFAPKSVSDKTGFKHIYANVDKIKDKVKLAGITG